MCTAIAALVLLSGGRAGAHEFSPGYLGFEELADGRYTVQWKVSLTGGLADALTPRLPERCRFDGPVHAYATGDARVQQRDLSCDGGLAGGRVAVDGLSGTMTDVLLRVDYLDGGSYTRVLTPRDPATTIPRAQGAAAVAATYLAMGTEHILIGVDHLLFVLALLLLVGDLRRLIVTVTAFTVAHSVTLGTAAVGLLRVPQAPVEAVIALSIVFLASELGRQALGAGERRDLAWRFPWIVAFGFGLLHGLGFAGALARIGLPAHALPLALASFNVGVEIGQLTFIAAVLGLLWLWRRARLPAPPAWRLATIYGMGSVAAFWVLDRTLGAL